MTTTDDLYALMAKALKGKTLAGDNIFTPRDWQTDPDLYPVIILNSPEERKESLGPNAPQYNVFSTIRLIFRVQSLAQSGDQGANACQAALGTFQMQVERSVINDYELYRTIEQIESVDTKSAVTAQGEQHLGEITMDFVLKFYQGADDFAPVELTPIKEIALYADLLNIKDPTGTYTPPFPYVPTPEPRIIGPDGRVEAGAVIELETD